VVVVVKEE
jgi:hypothetical protein